MASKLFWYLLVYGGLPFMLVNPLVGVAVYYALGLLRPQYTWFWSLSGTRFSYYTAIAALLGWIFLKMRGHHALRGCRKTNILMGLFFLWILISYWQSSFPYVSAAWWDWYYKGFLFYLVAISVVGKLSHVRILLWVAVLSTGYLAWDANDQYFFRGILRIRGLGFGDNNILGSYFAMSLPLCFFLMMEEKNKWVKSFLALLMPIYIHAILLTYSRGTMLAGLVLFPLLVFRVRRKSLAIVMGIILMAVTFRLAGDQIRDRFSSIASHEVDESALERKRAWAAAWAVARDYPYFGVGLRAFGQVSYKYGPVKRGRVAHNTFLQTAADSGFPAMALLILVMLTQMWRLQRMIWRWKHSPHLPFYHYAAGLQGSLVAYACCAAFLSLDAHDHFFISMALATILRRVAASPEAVHAHEMERLAETGPVPSGPAPAPGTPRLRPVAT